MSRPDYGIQVLEERVIPVGEVVNLILEVLVVSCARNTLNGCTYLNVKVPEPRGDVVLNKMIYLSFLIIVVYWYANMFKCWP